MAQSSESSIQSSESSIQSSESSIQSSESSIQSSESSIQSSESSIQSSESSIIDIRKENMVNESRRNEEYINFLKCQIQNYIVELSHKNE